MTVGPLAADLRHTIGAWVEQDPDAATRKRTDALLREAADGDASAAAELIDAFTGRLEFGTAGLRGALGPGPNRMNRVVVGQAAAGLATYLLDHGLAGGRVLVGFDARHNSDVFAADTAEIMAGAGFSVLITARPLPTPVIAFGIGHLSCVAAVVVTASHNPPQDNGYKVYLGDGSQIVPPADAEIAARIEQVAEQAEPDPDFPTVAFPNPEEPGAIDLALARAAEIDADLVIANDPDADRCAVATVVDGQWRMLHGDELGALLGDDALRHGRTGTYACSIVSSSLLSAMAAAYGQPFTYTLTGFKWIGRVPGLAFGYEEAIGYCVDPGAVPDKDGITALIRVLTLAAELMATGQTLADRLDEIAERYGVYETDQLSVRVDDLGLIAAAMTRLRAQPPAALAGQRVSVVDLAAGSPDLPPTDGILISGDSLKVVVRPSGTEPKLKCYLEARLPPSSKAGLGEGRRRVRELLLVVREEMSEALGLGTAGTAGGCAPRSARSTRSSRLVTPHRYCQRSRRSHGSSGSRSPDSMVSIRSWRPCCRSLSCHNFVIRPMAIV